MLFHQRLVLSKFEFKFLFFFFFLSNTSLLFLSLACLELHNSSLYPYSTLIRVENSTNRNIIGMTRSN